MRKILLCGFAALALGLFASSAYADTVTLTFTGLASQESVNNYYNGGTGGNGSTCATACNYGISFTSDSLALISQVSGGNGNFSNVPAPGINTVVYFTSGAGDTMNVAAGFDSGFSFYYASYQGGTVTVWSGLNGTGTLLATDTFAATPSYCNPAYYYSCWVQSGVSFNGTAQSVVFGGTANNVAFADITLGASTPGTQAGAAAAGVTPEPSSLLMLGTGLASVAGVARHRFKR